jgi:hypothetical protein
MTRPTGGSTGPPPSAAGHAVPLPGRAFMSSTVHPFFTRLVLMEPVAS